MILLGTHFCNHLVDTPVGSFQRGAAASGVQPITWTTRSLTQFLEMSSRDLDRGDAAYYAVLLRISSHGRVLGG
jgi:hypothetical protein